MILSRRECGLCVLENQGSALEPVRRDSEKGENWNPNKNLENKYYLIHSNRFYSPFLESYRKPNDFVVFITKWFIDLKDRVVGLKAVTWGIGLEVEYDEYCYRY